MKTPSQNPFNITKAVDFSDQQIFDYWIDLPESGGFQELAKPRSPMPMFILGGKGSGKTHLMRYFSYPLQKIRHRADILAGLQDDGYLGIYLRCGGLNSGRFKEKGQTEEAWSSVFTYYMDLWLAQLVIGTIRDAFQGHSEWQEKEGAICARVWSLLDCSGEAGPATMVDLSMALSRLQSQVDSAVNNCAIVGKLDVTIRATRGKLVFGIPRILAEHISSLKDCLFVYLIDELENLSEHQQKYVNTLMREKEPPCSFKIGARLYGIRTYVTFSADEANKEGSEFETLRLDTLLRENNKYELFAKRLIVRRLSEHGYVTGDLDAQKAMVPSVADWFEEVPQTEFAKTETAFVVTKYAGRERPYFESLRSKLLQGLRISSVKGVKSEADVDTVINKLKCPDYPLLEKVSIFLLYKKWNKNDNLLETANEIQSECQDHLLGKLTRASRFKRALEHFKVDLMAQLLRECDQKQIYAGLDTFIDMSMGLPRNLLVVLKNVFAWAVFNGEQPFRDRRTPISLKSQQAGVLEASDWFFGDARMLGTDARLVENSINRLGTLFRSLRFADKPVECSCTSFSCDLSRVSDETRRLIEIAEKWSLLISVRERRDRSSERLDAHQQMNPMLAPRWDLAIYRRAVAGLSAEECNTIFDESCADDFTRILQARIARMTAPGFGSTEAVSRTKKQEQSGQRSLWSESDDD